MLERLERMNELKEVLFLQRGGKEMQLKSGSETTFGAEETFQSELPPPRADKRASIVKTAVCHLKTDLSARHKSLRPMGGCFIFTICTFDSNQ